EGLLGRLQNAGVLGGEVAAGCVGRLRQEQPHSHRRKQTKCPAFHDALLQVVASSHYWHVTTWIARAPPNGDATRTRCGCEQRAGEGKRRKPPQSKEMPASQKAKLAAARSVPERSKGLFISSSEKWSCEYLLTRKKRGGFGSMPRFRRNALRACSLRRQR